MKGLQRHALLWVSVFFFYDVKRMRKKQQGGWEITPTCRVEDHDAVVRKS